MQMYNAMWIEVEESMAVGKHGGTNGKSKCKQKFLVKKLRLSSLSTARWVASVCSTISLSVAVTLGLPLRLQ